MFLPSRRCEPPLAEERSRRPGVPCAATTAPQSVPKWFPGSANRSPAITGGVLFLLRRGLLSVFILAAVTSAGRGNSLDNAQKFCAVLDATGVLAARCAVSSFSATLGLLVKANAEQAREFCDMVVQMAGENGLAFDTQWKVQVHSPASGNKPLAVCRFKTQAPTAKSFGLRPQVED